MIFWYVRLCDLVIPIEKWLELFANSGVPDQTPHSVAYDLGLHCLLVTLLGVSRLQWVKQELQSSFPSGGEIVSIQYLA